MKSTLHAWAWIGAAVMGMVCTEGWAQTAHDVMVIKQSNGQLLELPVENVAEVYFRTNWTDVVPAPVSLEAVDLGLPSGTKWANMNLGANTREEGAISMPGARLRPRRTLPKRTTSTALGAMPGWSPIRWMRMGLR